MLMQHERRASSLLLSRLDMADEENVKDALAGLAAAGSDVAKLAVWAGRWGAALCDRCAQVKGEIIGLETVEELEADLRQEKGRADDLEEAIRDGAKAIDQLLIREEGSLSEKHFAMISEIGDDLEGAL